MQSVYYFRHVGGKCQGLSFLDIFIDIFILVFSNYKKFYLLQAFCKHKAQKPLKKQMFQFENFRVRKLTAINALNFYITLCMAFLAHMSMKSETHALKVAIIQKADPIKEKIHFSYYRLAKGISGILSYVKEGIRLWFRTKRPIYRHLCLKLVA